MALQLSPVSFRDIGPAVRARLAALPGRVDSFVEDHVLASRHYRVVVDGRDAGFAAVPGCAYANDASKRVLERAGLVARSRLVAIEFQ